MKEDLFFKSIFGIVIFIGLLFAIISVAGFIAPIIIIAIVLFSFEYYTEQHDKL